MEQHNAVANELVKGYEAPEDVKTLSSEFNKQIADALDIDMYMTRGRSRSMYSTSTRSLIS